MKAYAYFIGFYLVMSLLSSCSNVDDVSVPKDDSWRWGYFKGEINGEKISLENDEYPRPIGSMGTGVGSFQDSDSIKGLQTGINYSEEEYLSVNLYPLNKGVRYITKWAQGDWNQDGIHIKIQGPNNGEYDNNIYYAPDPDKPFKAEIIYSAYEDHWHPVIEVKLDGVLYRSDNPKDSIIVKGTYGTRIS